MRGDLIETYRIFKELDRVNERMVSIVGESRPKGLSLRIKRHQFKTEHEYIVQMSKRTEKRQNQIITLNDQNRQNLEEIRNAKEKILAEFEVQKQ
eukprot:g31950.t1